MKAEKKPADPVERSAPGRAPDAARKAMLDLQERGGFDVGARKKPPPPLGAASPPTPLWKEIGKAIRRVRRGMDLNQAQMAQAVGVSRNWISNIERGWSCSQSVLALIFEQLQVPDASHTALVLVHHPGTQLADAYLAKLQARATKAIADIESTIPPLDVLETDPLERSRYTETLPGGLLRVGDQIYDEDGALLIGERLPPQRSDPEIRAGVAFRLRLLSAELRVIVAALQEFPPPVSIASQIMNGLKALILDSDDLGAEINVAAEYTEDLGERCRRINELADAFRQMVIELADAADRAYVVQTMIGEPCCPPSEGARDAFLFRLAYERQKIIDRYSREELDLMWYQTEPSYLSGYYPKFLRFARRDHGDNQA